jgi:hypothetical protein
VVRGSGRSTEQETADDERRPPGSFGVIDVAILIPQHDDEGRSATILPGVPLPEWALPSGPIAPEPDPAEALAAAAAEAAAAAPAAPPAPPVTPPAPAAAPSGPPLEAPALVLAGTALLDAPPAEAAAPVSPYAPPLPLGTNGPGPMRAGWDFPGSDFREQAHDEALAEAAEAAALAETHEPAGPALDPSLDPALALALTAPVPVLEPMGAPLPVAPPVGAPAAGPAEVAPVAPEAAPAAEAGDAGAATEIEHDADGDAPTSSRRPLALLAIVGGVAVAGAVAAFVWPGFLVAAEPAPVPVVPPVSAPAAAAPVELTTPASVGPYTKLTGAPAAALTKAVGTSALPGLSAPVSAVYGTGTTPAVTVIAWKAASPLGASAIPSAYAGFQGATAAVVTDITTTPVSSGGEMQCGTTVVSGAPASLCFWTDESSFGSVTVLKPSSPESAADTAVAVRSAVVGG